MRDGVISCLALHYQSFAASAANLIRPRSIHIVSRFAQKNIAFKSRGVASSTYYGRFALAFACCAACFATA